MEWRQLKKIFAFYGRFTFSYTQIGFAARSVLWSRRKPDFSGQRWLVTGASGGLGRAIALSAVRGGAAVTAVARSAEKLAALASEAGSRLTPLRCDLALQRDTARLLTTLRQKSDPIDVLVNNVGVLLDDFTTTDEGRETSFATNLLTHFQLTEGLIASGLIGDGGLVINMSSGGMYNVPLSVKRLNATNAGAYSGVAAYGFHKRAQVVLTSYWRRKFASRGISFYVMHPGWSDTEGVKRSMPRFRRILRSILRDEWSGSDTAIWLAASRPLQAADEAIWFDRKPRGVHVYEHTRHSNDTAETLVSYLNQELARFREAA
ncbi:MAG: SDR family NAD(P)-dependent oxidoreductase [Steroidobacteraceae bacterium]